MERKKKKTMVMTMATTKKKDRRRKREVSGGKLFLNATRCGENTTRNGMKNRGEDKSKVEVDNE